jgi:hypothetical protein
LDQNLIQSSDQQWKRVSVAVEECPLRLLLASLLEQGERGVEIDPSLAERKVSFALAGQSGEVLRKAARQVEGSLVGRSVLPVQEILARRVTRYEPGLVNQLLNSSSLGKGSVEVLPDGLVIARGEMAAKHLESLMTVFEHSERRAFRVEVLLTALTDEERDLLSLEASPSASVSASLAGISSSAKVDAAVTAISRRSRSKSSLNPSIAVVEGLPATIERGQRIPIPVKGVTQSGAIETLRFNTVSAGVRTTITVRAMSAKVARLNLAISATEVDPSIESLGATRGDSLDTEIEVGINNWAFVGSLARGSQSQERSSWLRLALGRSVQDSDLDCVVRVMD